VSGQKLDMRYRLLQPRCASASCRARVSGITAAHALTRKLPSGYILRGTCAPAAGLHGSRACMAAAPMCVSASAALSRFGARGAGGATLLTDSSALRKW
jgi:hypothetical protein